MLPGLLIPLSIMITEIENEISQQYINDNVSRCSLASRSLGSRSPVGVAASRDCPTRVSTLCAHTLQFQTIQQSR